MAPIIAKLLMTVGTYLVEKAIGIANEVRKGPQITATVDKKEFIPGDTTKHD